MAADRIGTFFFTILEGQVALPGIINREITAPAKDGRAFNFEAIRAEDFSLIGHCLASGKDDAEDFHQLIKVEQGNITFILQDNHVYTNYLIRACTLKTAIPVISVGGYSYQGSLNPYPGQAAYYLVSEWILTYAGVT